MVSPSVCPTPCSPHLSAGAHWGKGIGPTHEHFPASDNQDSHVVLTLLLKQKKGSNRGTSSPTAELGVFPSLHCATNIREHCSAPDVPHSTAEGASVTVPHPHAGGLVPTQSPSVPPTMGLLPAPSQAPAYQGHLPRSSLCFGRSGACPHWRPTLWPVGGAHRHHTAMSLTARAGSGRAGGDRELGDGQPQPAG